MGGEPSRARFTFAALLALCSVLAALRCDADDRFPPYDNTAEVQAYYKSKPDFFRFKTPADLPTDLKWENGGDLPEMGDPDAKKRSIVKMPVTSCSTTTGLMSQGGPPALPWPHKSAIM